MPPLPRKVAAMMSHVWNPSVNHIHRHDTEQYATDKWYSPAERMTQEGADRYAHQIGYRHSCAHHSHRLGSLSLLCHLHSHDGSRSEVGTMRQTLNESGAEQQPVSWGYGCDDGSDGDDGSQEHQYLLGAILVHEYQREGTGAYAQCIDGDEVACLRNGYVHRKCFNNDMQYLVMCSENIVRDNPKSVSGSAFIPL